MPEKERERTGLDVSLGRIGKDGLESDALLSDLLLCARLGALANVANCPQIFLGEAVVIRINNDLVGIDVVAQRRNPAGCNRFAVTVVIRVLQKLGDEPSAVDVEIVRQAVIPS